MTSIAIVDSMRVVMVAPPPEFLEERRRRGLDRRDEVWDGVLHVPAQPTMFHQRLEGRMIEVLGPIARARGLEVVPEPGYLDPRRGWDNYRVPDVVVVDPTHTTKRGVEGPAELVVEILSPGDESRDKLEFYAARGVKEIWLIEPETRELELYVLRGTAYFAVIADRGVLRSQGFGLELQTIAGPKLRITWADGHVEL